MDTVLEIEKSADFDGSSEMVTFVGLPTKSSERELSGSHAELFKGIVGILNDLLLTMIDTETSEQFIATRKQIFGLYQKTIRAMSNLANVVIPVRTRERLSWESFAELEADLMEQGLKRFGETAKDQAIFTVWGFRRISRLQSKLQELAPVEKEFLEKDREIAKEFSFYSLWSQFHLDCMIVSMRANKPIHPDVLEVICEGLRASVNAYGLIRRGLELRSPSKDDPTLVPITWDEEDQELVDSSMSDLAEMESEGY
jgi:hypothetical protein